MSPKPPTQQENINNFNELGLPDYLLKAVQLLGFNEPTAIQAQAIPPLLAGNDVLGQAQTGTGKTAAFALPLLSRIQVKRREPQILVLVPTRELALQVAEAFNSFAVNMPGLNILPIYGGQGYQTQLTMLRKGVQIVIGTPGRVMDHMRRETLNLDNLQTLILDEADEMLRMGFAEDVEWILQQIPEKIQIGLFSATMPPAIKAIAENYLHNPQRILVKTQTSTAATIKQYYWLVGNINKLDALSRIIETEESAAMIVFVKTKRATEELAEQLVYRGFNAVAINGDIVQKQRERVIEQLKAGRIKVLVATDVAARGIDVDRITHVINYDAPTNSESYVHRIGRTGRAGRAGTAIIFISPREKYMLRNIERATKQPIEEMPTPSIKKINENRVAAFKKRITEALEQDLSFYQSMIDEYLAESAVPPVKVAAALAKLLQGNKDLLLKKEAKEFREPRESREFRAREPRSRESGERESRTRVSFKERAPYKERERDARPKKFSSDKERTPFRERNSFKERDRDERPKKFSSDKERTPFKGRESDARPKRFSSDKERTPFRERGERDERPKKFSSDKERAPFKRRESDTRSKKFSSDKERAPFKERGRATGKTTFASKARPQKPAKRREFERV